MFEALEVSKHIVVLPASPDLEVLMIMLRKLIAKEDQTTNLKVLLLQLFLLLSRSLLLFLLPPQHFVLLSLPRSACSTGRTKAPSEKRERGPEQVVQLLAEQSQVVGLVVQRAAVHYRLDLSKWDGFFILNTFECNTTQKTSDATKSIFDSEEPAIDY